MSNATTGISLKEINEQVAAMREQVLMLAEMQKAAMQAAAAPVAEPEPKASPTGRRTKAAAKRAAKTAPKVSNRARADSRAKADAEKPAKTLPTVRELTAKYNLTDVVNTGDTGPAGPILIGTSTHESYAGNIVVTGLFRNALSRSPESWDKLARAVDLAASYQTES